MIDDTYLTDAAGVAAIYVRAMAIHRDAVIEALAETEFPPHHVELIWTELCTAKPVNTVVFATLLAKEPDAAKKLLETDLAELSDTRPMLFLPTPSIGAILALQMLGEKNPKIDDDRAQYHRRELRDGMGAEGRTRRFIALAEKLGMPAVAKAVKSAAKWDEFVHGAIPHSNVSRASSAALALPSSAKIGGDQ